MSLFESSKDFPKRIAIVSDSGSKLDYNQLELDSKKLSNFIPPRSLIFSLSSNTLGSIIGYYSFIKNKVVPFMLESKLEKSLLYQLIKLYKPEFLWLPSVDSNILSDSSIIFSIYNYSLVKTNYQKLSNINKDLALLLSTSGSTGSPKFVKISYKNLISNSHSIIKYLSIHKNERPITTLPMSYSYGLSVINTHLHVGATILLTNSTLFDNKFWEFLKSERATSISGVPYTYDILKKLRFFKMNLPFLKTLTQAGGKMDIELIKEFSLYCSDKEKKLFIMYGQTEATARMCYFKTNENLNKIGSIGKPIPGGSIALSSSGEIIYSGENVMLGYAENRLELSLGDVNKGILETGDLGEFDEDGYIYITGRKKRFIKIAGSRFNLDDIEHTLEKYFEINFMVIGTDENLRVFYEEDKINLEELNTLLQRKYHLNRSFTKLNLLSKIPLSSNGKKDYEYLKREI